MKDGEPFRISARGRERPTEVTTRRGASCFRLYAPDMRFPHLQTLRDFTRASKRSLLCAPTVLTAHQDTSTKNSRTLLVFNMLCAIIHSELTKNQSLLPSSRHQLCPGRHESSYTYWAEAFSHTCEDAVTSEILDENLVCGKGYGCPEGYVCGDSGHVALNHGVTGYHDIWHAMLQVREVDSGDIPGQAVERRKLPWGT